MQTLHKIKAKLERESSTLYEARQQIADMTSRIRYLEELVDIERNELVKLERAVQTGSLPDDAKMGLSGTSSMSTSALVFLNRTGSSGSRKLTILPPPPPPLPPISAPPLSPYASSPLGSGMMGEGSTGSEWSLSHPKKTSPQSVQPLKCFNWTKIPDNKVDGTIWIDIDDAKVGSSLSWLCIRYNRYIRYIRYNRYILYILYILDILDILDIIRLY